jgi:hypothetical protein
MTSLAHSSTQGHGSRRAVLPIVMIMMMTGHIVCGEEKVVLMWILKE